MEEYKSNSHKSKGEGVVSAPEKKVDSVVTGKVKQKKKTEFQKFADTFVSEDVANVKSYILMDVLVPAIKKAISDIVTDGIDMILYGESGHRRRSGGTTHISYRDCYSGNTRERRDPGRVRRNDFDFNELVFESRADAERVLSSMDDIIDQYGVVSVGDLYDLAHADTDNYTINKYGWTDIRSASVIRCREGYVIKLPKAMPLD